MAVTIYDIAREAKVGIGTVSRVFNNHPSVSEETRKRVLQVSARLNYHPHPYARGLARKRTNSILAIIPFFTTFFFVEILQAIQNELSEKDCDLILQGITHPDHAELSLRRNSFRGRVDGMLFFSMKMPDEFAKFYLSSKVPVVLVDTFHEDFDSFSVENVKGAYAATEHLISLGHTRIGMLNANLESLPARERLKGFRQAMTDAGLRLDPHLLRRSASSRLDGFTKECGYEQMKALLASGVPRPTALFISSDIQAAGALAAIDEAGLRCPDDIAVVGFDDIELAGHLGLTTMRQPLSEMGSLAVRRLTERMNGGQLPPSHVTFVPTLVARKSSGLPLREQQTHAGTETGILA
ncbi:MAG TPA: LacI family DNA-binding transcriptional regulator [Bacteroidota bacterium]|nr:LacI family DNA-binding transcriptional regulator [Bacteroidota bacterium]